MSTSFAQNATDGTSIGWVEKGVGEPALLVMGLGADGSAWDQHARYLAESFRCIIPDNRGVGTSAAPAGPYATEDMADDLAAVIDAAGCDSVAVIGISMGGAIAQNLALRHPKLVNRLVLVSSWARCAKVSADNFEELRSLRSKLSPTEFTRRLQLLIWAPESYEERADQLRADRADESTFAQGDSAFAAQCDASIAHDVLSNLGRIAVPTLVTVGSMDVFTPMSSSVELASGIPGAALEVFEGRGHAHHWEELDRFNRLCKEFLNANQ